ncbi:MAG: divergent polysaccharide deacetylase family protein, partial [Pseudorhodoplanes sp.]
MTTDDLNAPLGQSSTGKKRSRLPIAFPQAAAGALGLFVAVFALWALIADDPLGGEPRAIVIADQPKAAAVTAPAAGPTRYDGPDPAAAAAKPSGTQTVTIIDGSSGKRQEVLVPG